MSAPGIGSRIAERRADRGLTQSQLAELAGTHAPTVPRAYLAGRMFRECAGAGDAEVDE